MKKLLRLKVCCLGCLKKKTSETKRYLKKKEERRLRHWFKRQLNTE